MSLEPTPASDGAAPAPPPAPRSPGPRVALAFVAGVLFAAPALLLLLVPSVRTWADETRQRLVWGCVANDGVRLVLRPGQGQRLELVFRNEGSRPHELVCVGGQETADEVDVLVEDGEGRKIAPRELDPRQDSLAVEPRLLSLPPGTQATLVLDLARYVALPGPGRYRVTVERARLRPEEPRLRSNELVVDVR